ncbi:MAG: hypothetical protein KC656_05465 [Myxococcales bacterium]|nr:hypothetical protein [Myxococcales bacterium]MCB9669192.1 hypothetical protein [Alphaproteobacteria bacterium]MCB9692917.1 hypothetical protein [Alphaproteobacteria bacterium]
MSDSSPNIAAILGGGVLVVAAGVLAAYREHLSWDEWGPPLIVLGGAVVGGIGLASTLGRDEREARTVEAAGHRKDLTARHAEALEALAALETQQSIMDPGDYAAERKALLARGAEALRELDQLGGSPSPTGGPHVSRPDALSEGVKKLTEALTRGEIDEITYAKAVAALSAASGSAPAAPAAEAQPSMPLPPPPPDLQARGESSVAPQWTGAIYALAGFLLIGALLYFMQGDVKPRSEGQGMTGNQQLDSNERPPASAEPAFLAQAKANAEAALAGNPQDMEALNTLTQLNFNSPQQAYNYNQQALKLDPENADALIYDAVITMIMGMPDKSMTKFDAVIAKNPSNEKAYAYKGLALLQLQRYAEAVAPLEKAIELGVTDHAITSALQQAKAGGPTGGPMAAPAPAPAGGGAVIASGRVSIDPGRASFKAQTLFVNVKDPAMPGPPLAAVKLPPGPFPMEFRITEADRIAMGPMANKPLPANVQLSLRLDEDGNAFSKGPSDPQVTLETVALGTQGLDLTLK